MRSFTMQKDICFTSLTPIAVSVSQIPQCYIFIERSPPYLEHYTNIIPRYMQKLSHMHTYVLHKSRNENIDFPPNMYIVSPTK